MSSDSTDTLESHAATIQNGVVPLALVVAGSFAFRALFAYAPYTGIEGVADETESIFFSPNESSPLLIFLVTGWLLLGRRFQIQNAMGAPPAVAPASLFLALSAGIYIWAFYVGASDLTVVSLIFAVLGAGALLGGLPGLRAIWLPALFMLMLVPVPAVLINEVVFSLQLFTAKSTVAILEAVGIPAIELGDLMYTRGRIFQVIESCAGLRMIDTLFMSAILYAELFYRSRLQTMLLLLAAPFLGLLVNQVRVLSIVLSPQSSLAEGHTTQGIVMVVAGVLLIAALDGLLARVLPVPPPRGTIPKPDKESVSSALMRTAALVILLVTLGVTPFFVQPWSREDAVRPPLYLFDAQIDGWSGQGLKVDDQFMGTAGFSQSIYRRYTKEGQVVDLFLASDDRLRRRVSMRSGKTAWPRSGFRPRAESSLELDSAGLKLDVTLLESPDGAVVVYSWYEGVESLWVETLRSFLALDQSPFRRPGRALVVRLSTRAGPGREALMQAEARLQSFLQLALPQLEGLRGDEWVARLEPVGPHALASSAHSVAPFDPALRAVYPLPTH